MSQLITDLFSSFPTVVTSLAKGVKDACGELVWADPSASTKVLSDPIQFIVIFAGVSLGVGLLWGTFRMIRGKTKV